MEPAEEAEALGVCFPARQLYLQETIRLLSVSGVLRVLREVLEPWVEMAGVRLLTPLMSVAEAEVAGVFQRLQMDYPADPAADPAVREPEAVVLPGKVITEVTVQVRTEAEAEALAQSAAQTEWGAQEQHLQFPGYR